MQFGQKLKLDSERDSLRLDMVELSKVVEDLKINRERSDKRPKEAQADILNKMQKQHTLHQVEAVSGDYMREV